MKTLAIPFGKAGNTAGKFITRFTQHGIESLTLSGSLILVSLIFRWTGTFPVASAVLMTTAAIIAGIPVTLAAFRSLANRHVGIEVLVTIAAVGALFIGEQWEAAAVTFLFNLGGFLEARTMARTRRVIGDLVKLAPAQATVLRDNEEVEVPIGAVEVGETVVVRPGERIPVDGTVLSGTSRVDESTITGESYPPRKVADNPVYAGTFNQSGMLHIEVIRVGGDTTLARIIHRVEEAQEEKAPTERFMERFSRWYTPAIILLSLAVFFITRDVRFALTILVIGCPGALVISTPVSIVAGIGGAAREGILMKGGAHLEQMGKVSAVAFDKTGTLTAGHPDVVAVDQFGSEDVLYWAALAERGSEHPIGRAILLKADIDSDTAYPDSTKAHVGRGIEAQFGDHRILAGNRAFMDEQGVSWPVSDGERPEQDAGTGSVVHVARDLEPLGTITVADPIRPDAKQTIRDLRASGIERIVMLTGDDRHTAARVASELGIDEVHGQLLPEEKLEVIRQLSSEGYITAMVGDGINDTPALAAADVGIALGAAGTDIALETADIALMRDDLGLIPRALSLARRTRGNIRQNVVIALVTVAALLTGVLFQQVHMAGGMLIHEASVMVVILNGMRLLGHRRDQKGSAGVLEPQTVP